MPLSKLIAIGRLFAMRKGLNNRSFQPDGFESWSIGNVRITKITELEGEGFGEFLLPSATKDAIDRIGWIDRRHLGNRGGISLSVHSFVVEAQDKRIIVDTNVGNGKKRPVPIFNRMSFVWLDDLKRAGFDPNSIDIVMCTHLHVDHVGWNTIWREGKWVPTFPNARYLMVAEELAYWKERKDDKDFSEIYRDSVMPIIEAGLVDLVSRDHEIVPGLRLVSTPGHTIDHVSVMVEDGVARALISGDFLHHPVQLAHPEWNSTPDVDPDQAQRTRTSMLGELADHETLLLGSAFPAPSGGYVRRAGSAFRFETVQGV